MKAFKDSWMMYSEYCRSRGIEQNGQHIRKLAEVPECMKDNVTETSGRKSWAVDSKALDNLWRMI